MRPSAVGADPSPRSLANFLDVEEIGPVLLGKMLADDLESFLAHPERELRACPDGVGPSSRAPPHPLPTPRPPAPDQSIPATPGALTPGQPTHQSGPWYCLSVL